MSTTAMTPYRAIRSKRITELLPLVSSLRHAGDREMRRNGIVLQNVARDLDRLNEVELFLEQHPDNPHATELLDLLHRP